MIPLTKNRCMNGYTSRIGMIDTMATVYLITRVFSMFAAACVDMPPEPLTSADAYVDGDYGDTTVAAVKAFQKKYNLTADGIAGKETLKKLDSVYENANSAKEDGSLRMGDSGSAVKDLQTKLKKLGYYDGTVDSTFGSGTYELHQWKWHL